MIQSMRPGSLTRVVVVKPGTIAPPLLMNSAYFVSNRLSTPAVRFVGHLIVASKAAERRRSKRPDGRLADGKRRTGAACCRTPRDDRPVRDHPRMDQGAQAPIVRRAAR